MKSFKIAVFGHYDSRGGTMAVPLDEVTEEAVKRAFKAYDRMFGIEEPGDEITHVAGGMEARACDVAVNMLMLGDETPSQQDFMYVAELHHADDAILEGDLDEPLIEGKLHSRVLKEGGEDEERSDAPNRHTHPEIEWEEEVQRYGDQEFRYWRAKQEDVIKATLKRPVQLELVQFKPYTWGKRRQKMVLTEIEEITKSYQNRTDVKPYAYLDDPAYQKLSDEYSELLDKQQKRNEERAVKTAKVLKNPSTARWDDDAYGFVIGTW